MRKRKSGQRRDINQVLASEDRFSVMTSQKKSGNTAADHGGQDVLFEVFLQEGPESEHGAHTDMSQISETGSCAWRGWGGGGGGDRGACNWTVKLNDGSFSPVYFKFHVVMDAQHP